MNVSLSSYLKLHQKLVRSYMLDALVNSKLSEVGVADAEFKAQSFLAEIEHAQEKRFQSLGYGWDFRYQTESLAGNALVYGNEVVHAAFFRLNAEGDDAQLASLKRRRHNFSA